MVNQRTFGRRTTPQPRTRQPKTDIEAADSNPINALIDASAPSSLEMAVPALDEEVLAWKKARKQEFKFPWRQVSLMASLCFGIASFVLPDTLNDNIQWLLYALAAASLLGGIAGRRKSNP